MTFTEQDAQNDGLIKREVGREMAKVAQTQNPEVYEHFVSVCEETGRSPADVFGEMAVRALNSEQYADQVFSSELSMKQLRADEIRLEDVKYVKHLSEELGLNETRESHDPIDQLINQRLQSITQSPIPRLRNQQAAQNDGSERVMEYMEKLDDKIDRLESEVSEGEKRRQEEENREEETDKSIDDLFGGEDVQESEKPDIETSGGGGQVEDTPDTGEEEIDDSAVEEAMEGVGEVDDMESPMKGEPDTPFGEVDEEVEMVNKGHDVEEEEEGPAFSSEEANEE